ncbi:M20 family metallo-hydrolase [Peribacillus butanolivorans]|uniref:M20 family metallo-hydrolase n=1 Tax=Peribacillus butanolivorans TaxID=421767 RepID=UPI00363D73CF
MIFALLICKDNFSDFLKYYNINLSCVSSGEGILLSFINLEKGDLKMISNIKRIMKDIETITSYTKTPQNGCTRFSYSHEDKLARNYLFSQMEQLGLSIKVDAIGNIRAKYGVELKNPSIMIGSHIDTVENGGRFDGLAGVITALEVIRVLKEENVKLSKPIEIVIFAEEEGSNFGVTMLGSKALTGHYSIEELKTIKNENGQTVYDVVKDFDLKIENLENYLLKKDEVESMIELHIEQGAVLENKGKSIGVVQAIAGMKTLKVTLEGDSNHAGTTPMELRCDPMVGASSIISHIQKATKDHALSTTVATVGKITCQPNMANVIPQKVEFFVDVRDVDTKGIEFVMKEISNKVNEVATSNNLKSKIDLIGTSKSVRLSPRIIQIIEETAKENNYNYMRMNSGAVHDAAMLTEFTDVGMIFIPSIGGKSHCPEEYTKEEDIKAGCDLLINVIKNLAVSKKESQKVNNSSK